MQASLSQLEVGRGQVAQLTGQRLIRGLVADDPVSRGTGISVTLSDVLVQTDAGWTPLRAKVLVDLPRWPEHEYGEYLQLRGRLQPLRAGSAAVEALNRKGIPASMSYPQVSWLANPQANPLLVGLSRLRMRLATSIANGLPEPAAGTLEATLLGLRSAMPKAQQQALVDTGTVHIVAISGFKLSLLAFSLLRLALLAARLLPAWRWLRAIVPLPVLAALAGYTLLAGATPSALRAAAMAGLVVLASIAGREADLLSTLAVAVFALVLWQPAEVADPAFQLSCLSVAGIALLAEPAFLEARHWLRKLDAPGPLAQRLFAAAGAGALEACLVSLAVTAAVLPVLASSFHTVSLVSPVANLLAMPLLGPIMLLGLAGAAVGAIWPLLAGAALLPAGLLVALFDDIVRLTAALPNAAFPVSELSAAATIAWFAGCIVVACVLRSHVVGRRLMAEAAPAWRRLSVPGLPALLTLAGALVGGWLLVTASSRPPSHVRVTLLAVPGQAALIQTPGGVSVLVDGGDDSSALAAELGRLLGRDRHLDLVLLTSAKADHVGALPAVLARYTLGALVTPEVNKPSATFSRIANLAPRSTPDAVDLGDGARLRRTADGWRIDAGVGSVLFTDGAFEAHTTDGDIRVAPMLRGTARPGGDVLALAETGNVTLSLD